MKPHTQVESAAVRTVEAEVSCVLDAVDPEAFKTFCALFQDKDRRWFFCGQGRSGLVAQMAAMRIMHLGFDTHVLGEATAPSVRRGDGLLIISNSGTTPVSASFAAIARSEGATVAVLTANPSSPLTDLADTVLTLASTGSEQFGGSLFEQASLLILDALALEIAGSDPGAYERMQHRHTNMQ